MSKKRDKLDLAEIKTYLLSKPNALEDYPFGPDVMVFKVKGKMFATLGTFEGDARLNLKCDPVEAEMLRDIFDSVIPGYHMNKKHWNTVIMNGSVPKQEIIRMIDNSYCLVVKSLSKRDRTQLELHYTSDELYG